MTAIFARDKFQLTKRFVAEAGLRWEKQTGSSDIGAQTVNTNVFAPRLSANNEEKFINNNVAWCGATANAACATAVANFGKAGGAWIVPDAAAVSLLADLPLLKGVTARWGLARNAPGRRPRARRPRA